jgi:hypothetical protein
MSSPRTEILAVTTEPVGQSGTNSVGSMRTFKHCIADIIMGADVALRIGDCVKKPVGRGKTRRDAEEI